MRLTVGNSLVIAVFTAFGLIGAALASGHAQTIVYFENFESGGPGWAADNGLWQVGEATVGPVGSGGVAGTNLGGNYTYGTTSRFMSPWIELDYPGQEL